MKGVAAVLLAVTAVVVSGCSAGDDSADPVETSSCDAVVYEGEGAPDVIIVSDLPRRGDSAPTTKLMVEAIKFVLREHEFRAGDVRVGYQSCNDSVGDGGFGWDDALCRRNARAYVAAKDVLGVIGPYNSGCASQQIPIVSRGAAGPLAMISPSNTDHLLTRGASAEKLNPDGIRSYARVVTHDYAQGAAAAYLAKQLGAHRVVALRQRHGFDDEYARANANAFVAAAGDLQLAPVTFEWKPEKRYTALAAAVAAAKPDVVYLSGLIQMNAKTLVEDLRAALSPRVRLVAPDSFSADDIAKALGPAGEGLLTTVPGIPPTLLPSAGMQFLRAFGRAGVREGAQGAPEAAQATEVLLDAIARSDGTRASVVEQLFRTKVEKGILGSFSFDRNGDVVPAPVGVYRYTGGKITGERVVRVPGAGVAEPGSE